ncbi:MAG: hypothetical protein K8R39_08975 [Arcobacteraceae bacterium]|nr:hypothetical protein [Arcobacteraceae bacterium]
MSRKKIAITILLLTAISLFGADVKMEQPQKNKKMMVNDMIILPFPGGKIFKTEKIKLSDKQKEQLATEVRPIMHGKYNPLMQEIFVLEKSIQRVIKKNKTIFDARLQDKIDKIADLKKEAIEYKLKALMKIKSILTPEQWQVWINY